MTPNEHSFAAGARKLAFNVILQALNDLTADTPMVVDAREYAQVKEHAQLFFFGVGNDWRRSREFWAQLIGYTGDELTAAARATLRAPKSEGKRPRPCTAVLPSVQELLELLDDDGVLRLDDVRAKFGLDKVRSLSCLGKLRDKGFKVAVTARLSRAYRITPRD